MRGKMYKAIKSLYINSRTCVKLNNNYTEWFTITAGVRQGNILSPNLFSLYDLAEEIKLLNSGIEVDVIVSILLYADDIVLDSTSEELGLQNMLHLLHLWCNKWRLVVNFDKSQIVQCT